MSYEEKNTWLYGATAVVAYAVYLALVIPRLPGRAVADVAYQVPMLWTIGGAIVVGIVGGIVLGGFTPRGAARADVRDREISRFGDHVGQAFVVLGAVAALVLALVSAEPLWIANVLYLGFVLSAALSSVARLVAYRTGFQPW
jgi:hypothetical protein